MKSIKKKIIKKTEISSQYVAIDRKTGKKTYANRFDNLLGKLFDECDEKGFEVDLKTPYDL